MLKGNNLNKLLLTQKHRLGVLLPRFSNINFLFIRSFGATFHFPDCLRNQFSTTEAFFCGKSSISKW